MSDPSASDDRSPATAGPLPPELRFLKLLVTVLTGVMIVGLSAIVILLFIRLGKPPVAPLPELPAAISLPQGARAEAVTFARGYTIVVTDTGAVLVYDAKGQLAQSVTIAP